MSVKKINSFGEQKIVSGNLKLSKSLRRVKAPLLKSMSLAPLEPSRSKCPINMVLECVGDSWSLLIVRDIMFRNHTGYQSFLNSGEGIATNILADRLHRLESNGIVIKRADANDARKYIYSLSERGAYLAPVLIEMIFFGYRFSDNIDFPKEQWSELQRNRNLFTQKIIREKAPKVVRSKIPRPKTKNNTDETLSLLDLI